MVSWELKFGRLSGEGLSRQVSLLSLQSHTDSSTFGALAVNTERNRWELSGKPERVISGMGGLRNEADSGVGGPR